MRDASRFNSNDHALLQSGPSQNGITFSTSDVSPFERRDWLVDMICHEYTRVTVSPPSDGNLFNETTLYDWDKLRLSVIHSRGLTIQRPRHEPYHISQDNYLAVILVSGGYSLEQNGREVFLQPGDMTIYDATRPHRIHSLNGFSKILVSIPRVLMREKLAGIEHCTAMSVSGKSGVGAIATQFLQATVSQLGYMQTQQFKALSEQSLDLVALAFQSIRPQQIQLSRSRSMSLSLVKNFVAMHLKEPSLNASLIANKTGLSSRYINDLFNDENTSLMRFVWRSRLEKCQQELIELPNASVSAIAYKWGFNDMSHFSRAFKNHFGINPSSLRK